ncbi:MAG: peptide chain release factor-like protein [Desulfuromonadaceae bacterium]
MAAEIDDRDLVFTFFRSSGPGGQKKNKTESAVRLQHRPSGLVVTATESRSQAVNKRVALMRLQRRLQALRRRAKPRLATQPTRASRERRLDAKKRHAATKKNRVKVDGH